MFVFEYFLQVGSCPLCALSPNFSSDGEAFAFRRPPPLPLTHHPLPPSAMNKSEQVLVGCTFAFDHFDAKCVFACARLIHEPLKPKSKQANDKIRG